MENEDQVFCVDEGVYKDQLSYGTPYPVLELDQVKRQLRTKGDRGRKRWFPTYCFSKFKPVELLSTVIYDPLDLDFVDVHLQLDDGKQYWTTFSTPDGIRKYFVRNPSDVSFFNPHLILVESLTEKRISEALDALKRSNRLLPAIQLLDLS